MTTPTTTTTTKAALELARSRAAAAAIASGTSLEADLAQREVDRLEAQLRGAAARITGTPAFTQDVVFAPEHLDELDGLTSEGESLMDEHYARITRAAREWLEPLGATSSFEGVEIFITHPLLPAKISSSNGGAEGLEYAPAFWVLEALKAFTEALDEAESEAECVTWIEDEDAEPLSVEEARGVARAKARLAEIRPVLSTARVKLTELNAEIERHAR